MILNKEGAMHSAKQIVCKHAIAKKSILGKSCYYLSSEVVGLLRAIYAQLIVLLESECFIRVY